jgi:hypothetical protein
MNMKIVIIFDPLYLEIPLLRDSLLREATVVICQIISNITHALLDLLNLIETHHTL